MDWTQVFAIIGATGAFIFWAVNKLDTHITAQNSRIDQLYQMFVDLLKEGRKP